MLSVIFVHFGPDDDGYDVDEAVVNSCGCH